MTPSYKRVSVPMPHCPKCNEQLSGNGSYMRPYECSEGVLRLVWGSFSTGEYEIIPKDTNKSNI